MKTLAIETTGFGGSAALLEGGRLVAEKVLDTKQGAVRTLFPAIQNLLRESSWRPRDVRLVAVANGPGSFTGLRIGVTAANTFAYATGAVARGVDSLRAIALQTSAVDRPIVAIMDAGRSQLFTSTWIRQPDQTLVEIAPTRLTDVNSWLKTLPGNAILIGPGLKNLSPEHLANRTLVPSEHWAPRASSIGLAAWHDVQSGVAPPEGIILPNYFRPSAAEERRGQ